MDSNVNSILISKIKRNQNEFLRKEAEIPKSKNIKIRTALAYDLATFATRNITDIFSSPTIENVFLEEAKKISVKLSENYRENTILHVMTEAYTSGGHTRCVERWIKHFPQQQHSCVVLSQYASFPSQLQDIIKNSGGDLHIYDPEQEMQEKAKRLREYASSFAYIVLHIHMNDPIAIIAFGTDDFKRPVIFFNHADHSFWLGVSVSDYVLDLNSYGHKITANKRGVQNSSIIGIPSEESSLISINKLEARKKVGIPIDKKVIFSSGRASKFWPIGKISFYNIVSDLIQKNPNLLFYFAGVNKREEFWPKLEEKYPNNVVFTGILDSQTEYPIYLSSADLVLDSYPVGGGTAIIDAIRANKPVLTLNTELQSDYLIKSKCCCKDYSTFLKMAQQILDDEKYACQIYNDVYNNYMEYNMPGAWDARVSEVLKELPIIHKVNKFKRPSIPDAISSISLIVYYLSNPDFGGNLMNRIRRFRKKLISIHFKKGEKTIKLFGFYLLNKRKSSYRFRT